MVKHQLTCSICGKKVILEDDGSAGWKNLIVTVECDFMGSHMANVNRMICDDHKVYIDVGEAIPLLASDVFRVTEGNKIYAEEKEKES